MGIPHGLPERLSFARGHGEINLGASTVSGIICQEKTSGPRSITMTVAASPRLSLSLRDDVGFPGNVMKIIVHVRASNDPRCKAGTVGHATLFASYNGVRSDSVQFFFPAACKDQDQLYHGTQVNNQVPPL